MSGGEIAVLPAAAVILPAAAAAAVIVGAGLAAALVVKGAQAGTAATGRALERFGDEMERTAKAQDDLAVRTRLWELAAGAVVQANQELTLLAARAERAGVRPPLPSPFDLTGRDLAGTHGWVAHTREALLDARAAVERAEADLEQRVLLAKLPAPADSGITTVELLARYQGVLANRRQESQTVQPPAAVRLTVDRDRVGAEIDEILARLDVDASTAEREQAILAAARAAKQQTVGASSTYIEALASTVDERINPKVARRREAAGLLVALEHPVVAEAIAETTPLPPYLRSVERLREVVRGDADLTAEDRRDAMDSVAWAEKAVERRRLLEAMAETFTELGYAVTSGLQVNHTAALSVARDGWRDAHSADVWIDQAGGVQWKLVELAPGATGEASRCEELNRSVRAIGETLAERGFDAAVRVPETLVKPVRRHTARPGWQQPSVEDTTPQQQALNPHEENE